MVTMAVRVLISTDRTIAWAVSHWDLQGSGKGIRRRSILWEEYCSPSEGYSDRPKGGCRRRLRAALESQGKPLLLPSISTLHLLGFVGENPPENVDHQPQCEA
jgi:hypothetical protein